MDKGKTRKEKKYFSVMFVPHFSGKVKVFKLSGIFIKITLLFVLVLVSISLTVWFVKGIVSENERLKAGISELKAANIEQNDLLGEKAGEINALRQREKEVNDKVKEYMDKYNEITDKYLKSRGVTNRSGNTADRSGVSFSKDLSQLKEVLTSLTEMGSTDSSTLSSLSATEDKLEKYMDSIPTRWPAVGKLGSKFGYRRDPFLWTRKFHEGIDISAPYGNNIRASASGRVIFAGYMSGYGRALIIEHGRGMTTLYGHTSKLIVKEGQTVKKGEVVAKIGSSGRSTGPHLHFEIRIKDSPTDPLKYLASS
jgi:murein DD-endopeptidase MepM/ murein hydrolase activator NlpD